MTLGLLRAKQMMVQFNLSYLQEYEAYHMKLESQHKIIQMELPPEGTFHVVVAMPFLDVNPLAGEI